MKPTAKTWAMAARPKTLPAAAAPVTVAAAAAFSDGVFAFFPVLGALAGALLLQVGVNLANDYFDFKKGIDTPERLGPVRVTQSGLISPETVKTAMILVFLAAGLVGVYLTAVGGLPIFLIGVAAILSALAYSGGPFPLASNGLGDLFVFVFFGPAALCGTYYLQALQMTPKVFLLSIPVGFLITAVMAVNNLRDIETDRKTGKITLAVMLGKKGTIAEHRLLVWGAYLAVPACIVTGQLGAGAVLPLVSAPIALDVTRGVQDSNGKALNRWLAATASLAFLFSVLLAVGISV